MEDVHPSRHRMPTHLADERAYEGKQTQVSSYFKWVWIRKAFVHQPPVEVRLALGEVLWISHRLSQCRPKICPIGPRPLSSVIIYFSNSGTFWYSKGI